MGFLSVIGQVFIWIFAVIAVFILILFAFSTPKIRVILKYDGKFSYSLKFLFFTFCFGNKKDKQKNKHSEKKQKSKVKSKKKDKKGASVLEKLVFADYLNIVKTSFTEFVFKIKIEKFCLNINVAGENAATTALTYGKINAAVYPITSFLTEKGALQDAEINIRTDFLSDKSEYYGEVILYSRFISVIRTGVLIFKYIISKK